MRYTIEKHAHTHPPTHPHLSQGPILAFLYAVKELREELGGSLPVNVAFVFEVGGMCVECVAVCFR